MEVIRCGGSHSAPTVAVAVDPWNGGGYLTTTYLGSEAVPDDQAVAARAVVLRPGLDRADSELLVLDTEHGPLVLPGGRCEPGRDLEQAL